MSIGPTLITDGPRTQKFKRCRPPENPPSKFLPNFLCNIIRRRSKSSSSSQHLSTKEPLDVPNKPPPPSLNELAKREETLVKEMMQRRYSGETEDLPCTTNNNGRQFHTVLNTTNSVPAASYANFGAQISKTNHTIPDCTGYSLPPPVPVLAPTENTGKPCKTVITPERQQQFAYYSSSPAIMKDAANPPSVNRPPMPLPRSSLSHDNSTYQPVVSFGGKKSVF